LATAVVISALVDDKPKVLFNVKKYSLLFGIP
jgi:hypothetical protein